MSNGGKIKIVLFSDTHLGFDYPVKPRIERRRRGADFFDNFHRVLDEAAESRADLVVHGGDLFFRSRRPAVIVDEAYAALFDFAGRGIPIVLVPGNHERSRLPDSLYLAHPNIYVFARPMTYTFRLKGTTVNVSGFPFERSDVRGRFTNILADTGWGNSNKGIKLLCLHQAVEGAKVGPSNYTFRYGDDVLRYADLPGDCDAVLAGHIHRHQVLGGLGENRIECPPVIYPGSVERTSFAEQGEEKGYYGLTFGPPDVNGCRLEDVRFCRLPARPMVDLVLDGGVGADNVESYLAARIAGMDKNSIVRIRSDSRVSPELAGKLTAGFLRNVFPGTMNVRLSADFRRGGKDVRSN
jgi:DNA repair exonuclease SbcCD nuclease subunit